MHKVCRNGEFPDYVLSGTTKIIKAHIWLSHLYGEEEQDFFEEIKHRLIILPVLHMLNTTGGFCLYSDTSKFATGSVLY